MRMYLPFPVLNVDGSTAYRPSSFVSFVSIIPPFPPRHNDNIMLTKAGRFLHIDFGHFLGNFKEKFGFKREKAPFIFTPAMAAVLGGEGSPQYAAFVHLACHLFRATRQHARLITTLFTMMQSCGIPELRSVADVEWIERKLLLVDPTGGGGGGGEDGGAGGGKGDGGEDEGRGAAGLREMSDAQLDEHFEKLVAESLSCQTTRVNDAVHLLKHA